MVVVEGSSTLISRDGSKNTGKGVDDRGKVVTKPWTYGTVTTATGRVWLDRNLGATRVATSVTDAAGYGDYYQWGRPEDGHQAQYRINNNSSGFTNTKSSTSVPTNSLWIVPTDNSNDWLSTPDNTLWAGANPATNPCPVGFRIPTEAEWKAEIASWSNSNPSGAFASSLKLPMAGGREGSNGVHVYAGLYGMYWSSTVSGDKSQSFLLMSSFPVSYFGFNRNNGASCRCIKN